MICHTEEKLLRKPSMRQWQEEKWRESEREANHHHRRICSHLFTICHSTFVVRRSLSVFFRSGDFERKKLVISTKHICANISFGTTFASFFTFRQTFVSAFSMKKKKTILHIHQHTTMVMVDCCNHLFRSDVLSVYHFYASMMYYET